MSYWPALSAAGAQQGPRSVRERQGGSPRPLWCWPLTCALLLGGACHEGSPAAPPDAAVSIPADLSAAQPDLLVPIPGVPPGAVAINEVHATNLGGLLDEDGDAIPPEPVSGVPWEKRWMDYRYRVAEVTALMSPAPAGAPAPRLPCCRAPLRGGPPTPVWPRDHRWCERAPP